MTDSQPENVVINSQYSIWKENFAKYWSWNQI